MKRVDPSQWLSHLAAFVPVALDGADPEGVHQVRVAGRRMRVWLSLGGHRAFDDDLRWLIRGLSPARDYDVLLHTSLGRGGPFAAWLRARRDESRAAAQEVLQDGRLGAMLEALPHLSWPRVRDAKRRLQDFEARLARHQADWREAHRRGKKQPGEAAAGLADLHRARRSLRKVRYARDWLGLDPKGLAERQDALGAVCDVNALWGHVAQWEAAAGVEAPAARQALAQTLERMLELLA